MRSLFYILFFFVATGVAAQSAKVVSAYNAMEAEKYGEALGYINQAKDHEKTRDDEKTWRYRGQIYLNIAISEEEYEVSKGEAIKEALKSFEKAKELDVKERWIDDTNRGYLQSKNVAVNLGIQAYNDQNYTESRDLFLLGAEAGEKLGQFDTLAVYNAGLAAEQAEDYDMALTQYEKVASVGYLGPKMYVYMANLQDKREDTEAYLKTVQEGRKKYPEDADLIVYELNYYLKNNKFEEAENNLKLAIEKEPNNKQLHFSLGVVYDNLGNTDAAVDAYKKAIEIDPQYFDAVYNLGAMYFNTAVEMNNAANEITDNKKYAAAREEAKEVFKLSKPHLEKAHELDPTDMGAMSSLVQLYALLNETDNYTAMKAKLDAAKAGQ